MTLANKSPAEIASEISDLAESRAAAAGRRIFVAIAGAPGSGKSTVAEEVVAELERRGHPTGLLAMDGFHYDNRILDQRGLRARKGAPETFDLDGFKAILGRLADGGDVAVPIFDRSIDKSVAAAIMVDSAKQMIVVEGNYLLLDEPGWRDLRDVWDLTVVLYTDEAELEQRLMQRWLHHGFDEVEARRKVNDNDMPNARRIQTNSFKDVDVTL